MIESRDKGDALSLKLLDIIVRELHSVFNRIRPGRETVMQSLPAKSMTGDFMTFVVGLFDERLNFLKRERGRDNQRAVRGKCEIVGSINFDPVRAVHELFADRFARLPRVIDCLKHRRQRNIAGVTLGTKSPGSREAPSRNLQARALYQSIVDGRS